MRECLEKSLLNRVQGVSFLTQQPIRHPVGYVPIASKKLLQSLPIPLFMVRQQLVIAPGRRQFLRRPLPRTRA
jgi:hypothetical protein